MIVSIQVSQFEGALSYKDLYNDWLMVNVL